MLMYHTSRREGPRAHSHIGWQPRCARFPQSDRNRNVMMIHVAEGPTGVAVRRSLARWNLELHGGHSAIRYGFSVVCVAVALGVALALRYYGFRNVTLPAFDLAIAVITWYAG